MDQKEASQIYDDFDLELRQILLTRMKHFIKFYGDSGMTMEDEMRFISLIQSYLVEKTLFMALELS